MGQELSRVLAAAGLHKRIIPVIELLNKQTGYNGYNGVLDLVHKIQDDTQHTWQTAALAHRMIVAWNPETAIIWLSLLKEHFANQTKYCSREFFAGTFIGLLQAGVELDSTGRDEPFQRELLDYFVTFALCPTTSCWNRVWACGTPMDHMYGNAED